MIARTKPADADAFERAAVGCLLLAEGTHVLTSPLDPAWIRRPEIRACLESILDLEQRGQAVDLLTVAEDLTQRTDLEDAHELVADLATSVASHANVDHFAGRVRNAWALRRIQEQAIRILTECSNPSPMEAEARFAWAQDLLQHGAPPATAEELSAADCVEAARAELIQQLQDEADAERSPLLSGWPSFDDVSGYLAPGTVTVVAARPSMGKSALALNLLRRLAWGRRTCVLASIEMSRAQVGGCLAQQALGHPARNPQEFTEAMEKTRNEVHPHLLVFDQGVSRISDLRRMLHRLGDLPQGRPEVLAVDYLQLLEPERGSEARGEDVIAEFSRKLKALAKEFRVHVLAVAQLNRKNEGDKVRPPRMSDLRGSGQIEQDADRIVLLHRPGYYDPARDEELFGERATSLLHVNVAKNRSGPVGKVSMVFNMRANRIRELYDHERAKLR